MHLETPAVRLELVQHTKSRIQAGPRPQQPYSFNLAEHSPVATITIGPIPLEVSNQRIQKIS